jgi:hypothetical protein
MWEMNCLSRPGLQIAVMARSIAIAAAQQQWEPQSVILAAKGDSHDNSSKAYLQIGQYLQVHSSSVNKVTVTPIWIKQHS